MDDVESNKIKKYKAIDFFCGGGGMTCGLRQAGIEYDCFDDIEESPEWSFEDFRSVEQWTHGYHRYPAKFLPNVVKKLIDDFALKDAIIADPFAGCGTTLVEAKAHGYESLGVDINPVATLITNVKTTPIAPELLDEYYSLLAKRFDLYQEDDFIDLKKHERIDYWFRPQEKYQIAFLYQEILRIDNNQIKNFFLVSLSHILKNCSRWLQSSTKPQIDKEKKIALPFEAFEKHTMKMMQKNKEFFLYLQSNDRLNKLCEIKLGDARNTGWADSSIGTIITSPPYVTSYEYADIHQLTGYWFDYFSDLKDFRQKFIGTSFSTKQKQDVHSFLGQKIVDELEKKSPKIAKDVANYFNDMDLVAKEMFRVLHPNGIVCVVIGNTRVKDIDIKSAEVFWDLLRHAGFKKNKVIKRSIPHKLMPTIRNTKNGKFTKVTDPDSKKVYPNEYIIIVTK